ncbi:protein kinase domain-containing protein [Amnibacterium setariae]|uniref:protein kinase domain-containing protein n=1 Tax=Amnibacterium setariae TaxID=2306585 RepID=UPI001314FCBE|nr:GAF domain-containing serine/threonine-protein kinase [Amnibacterium setariae]
MDATDRRIPDALSERYVLGPRIGGGETSSVHVAHDRLLGRRVAIKLFDAPASSVETLRRQEREARLIASLDHYAVTTLLDAGVETADPARPQLYLVMEHVPGGDLRRVLRSGRLTWQQVAWLGHDLAEALDAVHAGGFLHRDVTPANVLVATRDADARLRPKLADFGFATEVGALPGPDRSASATTAYLAPEQLEGAEPTTASEVWSLGLVLLEALTGRPDPSQEDVAVEGGEGAVAVLEIVRAMTRRDPAARTTLRRAAAGFQDAVMEEQVRRRDARDPGPAASEAARLAALRRYNVLDTPPEKGFDRVTRVVARTLDVPVSAIAIVDVDRVWLKSRRGVDREEFDRPVALAMTAVDGADRPWSVRDALQDPATAEHPLVAGPPHVRSFAAAPIVTHDGHRLGALYAADVRPRAFTAGELETLGDFAAIVMNELELRLASRRALFDR